MPDWQSRRRIVHLDHDPPVSIACEAQTNLVARLRFGESCLGERPQVDSIVADVNLSYPRDAIPNKVRLCTELICRYEAVMMGGVVLIGVPVMGRRSRRPTHYRSVARIRKIVFRHSDRDVWCITPSSAASELRIHAGGS